MRMTDAILPGSPPRATLKATHRSHDLFSLPHSLAAGQANPNERVHSLSVSYPARFQQQTDGQINT